MSIRRVSCVEVTCVPEMIFEVQKYKYKDYHSCYHIGDCCRGLPCDGFIKVTHAVRDNIFVSRFE